MNAQIVVCACGAESPATDREDRLDAWEDEHVRDCPHAGDGEWCDLIEARRFPSLPAMTRYPAELPTPTRPRPTAGRRHTKWKPA